MDIEALRKDHEPRRVRQRLEESQSQSYIGDAVLGGIDGCITTFAVVASVVGAGLSSTVAVVLGFANLAADGFSMAVSNYQASKSETERLEEARKAEERHIDAVPEGEREEVRQIFAKKGFSGDQLETIVEVISSDRKLWVETMLVEEYGLRVDVPDPKRAALTTFAAFAIVGVVPLLPLMLMPSGGAAAFAASTAATGCAFFAVGSLKGWALQRPVMSSGLETLLTGSAAAALAYGIGAWFHAAYGVMP